MTVTVPIPDVTLAQVFVWFNHWSMFCVVLTLTYLWYLLINIIINGNPGKYKRFKTLKKFIMLFYPYGVYRWFLYGTATDNVYLVILSFVIGAASIGLVGSYDAFESNESTKNEYLQNKVKDLEKELDIKKGVIENYKIVQNELKSKLSLYESKKCCTISIPDEPFAEIKVKNN